MNKTLIGIAVIAVGGFLLWQVLKPQSPNLRNPGATNSPYRTPTQPSQGGITNGLLSLGTGLANAFSAYENHQTADATYEQ